MSRKKVHLDRRTVLKGAAAGAAATLFAPNIVTAQTKMVRIGMPTILSGRVAQLGTSSRNGLMLEVEKVNAAGGLAGRQIEMVIRDSKGQPQEAARVARELINSDGCEFLIDAEASSGAFAVQEVAKDLGVLCLHSNSETSSLTADPKIRIPNAFRLCRQGIHDSIAGGAYAAQIAKANNLTRWATCSPDYAILHGVPEALLSAGGAHDGSLAEAVPARLHRGHHQGHPGEAPGALLLPVGW